MLACVIPKRSVQTSPDGFAGHAKFSHTQAWKVVKALQPITVLYVEDHDLVLFTVKQMLELEGWRVRICRDGNQARKQLASDEHYDLIILDVELPGASGFELIRQARALPTRQAVPIVMFTASDCTDEVLALGANECLTKPGGIKDLLAVCYRLLKLEPAHEADKRTNRAINGG